MIAYTRLGTTEEPLASRSPNAKKEVHLLSNVEKEVLLCSSRSILYVVDDSVNAMLLVVNHEAFNHDFRRSNQFTIFYKN